MIKEPGFLPYPSPLNRESDEAHIERASRFGNKDAIIEIMSTCDEKEIRFLGKIGELYPETTPPHTNIVEVIEIPSHHEDQDNNSLLTNKNEVTQYVIEHEGTVIYCVFKPFDGENKNRKEETGHNKFYSQEAAAYIVSEAFGFDLVPPTVIRTIQGREGALQLFIHPEEYAQWETCQDKLNITQEQIEKLETSRDFYNMAMFDFILANADRHQNNWLLKTRLQSGVNEHKEVDLDEVTPATLVAIDHGETLSTYSYRFNPTKGPSRILTEIEPTQGSTGEQIDLGIPKETPLPAECIVALKQGISLQEEVTKQLLQLEIDPQEILQMWIRTYSLIHEGVFLSNRNRDHIPLPIDQTLDLMRRYISLLTTASEDTVEYITTLSPRTIQTILNTPLTTLRQNPSFAAIDKTVIHTLKQFNHPIIRANI